MTANANATAEQSWVLASLAHWLTSDGAGRLDGWTDGENQVEGRLGFLYVYALYFYTRLP